MTPDELLDRLAPIRIPAEFAAFGPRDALAAVALGLVAGLMLSWLWGIVSRRRTSPEEAARARIDALAGLEPQARLAGLAGLLRGLDPAAEGPGLALYDPGAPGDVASLEAAILGAARRRRRT